MAEARRRVFAVESHETDIQATARAVNEANRAEAAKAADKMVTVSIENDFTLTDDLGVKFHYKAGLDDMPLSHANHWFAKNAGKVKLYTPRRGGKAAAVAEDTGPVTPPQPDPEILKTLDRTSVEIAPGGNVVDPTLVK